MFADKEVSRQQGAPIELYRFEVGSQIFAYTNADDDYPFDGITYKAVPITRTNINSSGTLDRSGITVTVPESVPLASLLRGYPLSTIITLKIRQGHLTDPDEQFLVAWAGRMLSSKGGNGQRQMTCQPISTSLRRVGLRRNWQLPCPHALYGDRCRASLAAATNNPVVVVNTVKSVLRVQTGWHTRPFDKYRGGLLMWNGEVRTILRLVHLGDNTDAITLGGPITIPPGTIVAIALGCNHQMDDCRYQHVPADEADYGGGNIRNYGGQPFIPTTNPVGYVSNYN